MLAKLKTFIKKSRYRLFGLSEIEDIVIAKTSSTNSLLEEAVSTLKKTIEESSDKSNAVYQAKIEELSKEIKLLAEPANLIPRLNDYTGRYYLSLEYPPSRNYTRRWTDKNPHAGLVKLFQKDFSDYIEHCHNLVKLKPYFDQIDVAIAESDSSEPGWTGGAINAIDAAFLYYFVATMKPKTYLEIGSGVTTLFAARAKRDHNLATEIISIDPEPRYEVDRICDRIIRQGLEMTDLSIFAELEPGDIIFMDGSHRSFMNSDVTVFMLDILPQLKPGIIVHFHDIVLPYDYPEMFDSWYWNEQYILAAYLLAAQGKIKFLMSSQFMSKTDEFKEIIHNGLLTDWQGSDATWLNGGSLWFTHL